MAEQLGSDPAEDSFLCKKCNRKNQFVHSIISRIPGSLIKKDRNSISAEVVGGVRLTVFRGADETSKKERSENEKKYHSINDYGYSKYWAS